MTKSSKPIKSLFIKSLRWNIGETIAFHLFKLTHQWALYSCISRELSGKIGIAFSLSYIAVPLLTLGLDNALGGAAHMWRSCRACFRTYILKYVSITFCLAVITASMLPRIIALIISLIYKAPNLPGLLGTQDTQTTYIFYLIALLAFAESMRAIVKAFLQLTFNNKTHAAIELLTIIGYIIMIWTLFFYNGEITVATALAPLILISFIASSIGIFSMYRWYTKQPITCLENSDKIKLNTHNLLTEQAYIFIHSITRELFSGNALVLYTARYIDIESTAALKLVGSTLKSTLGMIKHIFSLPSMALFSYAKANSKNIYRIYATQQLYKAVGIALACWVILHAAQGGSMSLLILACLIVETTNILASVQESFHLAESRARKLAFINTTIALATIMLLLVPLLVPYTVHYTIIIGWVALLRIGSLYALKI